MRNVEICFETDNAAFGENDLSRGAEAAKVLRKLADWFEKGLGDGEAIKPLMDSNGNRVGTCHTRED
jgi:hypothetical protein